MEGPFGAIASILLRCGVGSRVGRKRSEAMKRNEDDVGAWTFNGQRTSCTVRIARLMLAAAHRDWSDERIEQEPLVRVEAEQQA
jgi:hypothetical protein